MTIDKPKIMEPKIPEPLLGVSRETLGDPCSGDGGGMERRKLRDGTRRGSRSTSERRMLGARKEEWRGSRSSTERSQLGAWKEEQRGSRGKKERRWMEVGRIEGRFRRPSDAESVTWRRCSDGTWRRTQEVPESAPIPSNVLWPEQEAGHTIHTVVSIPNPDNDNHPVYFFSEGPQIKGNRWTFKNFYIPLTVTFFQITLMTKGLSARLKSLMMSTRLRGRSLETTSPPSIFPRNMPGDTATCVFLATSVWAPLVLATLVRILKSR